MDADILVRVLHKSGSLHFANTEQQLENIEENASGSVCSRPQYHLVEMEKSLQRKEWEAGMKKPSLSQGFNQSGSRVNFRLINFHFLKEVELDHKKVTYSYSK